MRQIGFPASGGGSGEVSSDIVAQAKTEAQAVMADALATLNERMDALEDN